LFLHARRSGEAGGVEAAAVELGIGVAALAPVDQEEADEPDLDREDPERR
jgi:hypothetical protein